MKNKYSHYLGIDLHKRSATWVLINTDDEVIWKRKTLTEVDEINKTLISIPVEATCIKAVVEPVCGWRWFSNILEDFGIKTDISNPLKTRMIADSKLKTDSVDALMLAQLLRANYLPKSYKAPDNIADLRSLIRQRYYLVCLRTGIKNRIQAVVTHKGINEIRDIAIKEKGMEYIKNSDDEELKNLLCLLERFNEHLKPLEKQISDFVKKSKLVQKLMSMPTIGPITASTIVAEVGDFKRFKSADHLASYAGLVPRQRSSGSYERFGRITKTGSKYLRSAMVESAMRLRPDMDTKLYSFYLKIREKKSPMKARVALARKMLVILYQMIKTDSSFISIPSPVNTTKRCDLVRPF